MVLKTLKRRDGDIARQAAAFRQEAALQWRASNHPNVVRVCFAATVTSLLCIVMCGNVVSAQMAGMVDEPGHLGIVSTRA